MNVHPPYWRVPLTGQKFDIDDVTAGARSGELMILRDDEGEAYIVSPEFERLNDPATIHDYAVQLRDLINGAGAALIDGFMPVDIGAVQRVFEDGQAKSFFQPPAGLVSLRARVEGTGNVRDAQGNIRCDEPPEPPLSKALRCARDDDDLARVLQLLNNASWVNLYIIHEIMQRVLGTAYLDIAGTTKDELGRFTHAANAIARHDPKKFDPLGKTMTHAEAKALICRHVTAWLRSLPPG